MTTPARRIATVIAWLGVAALFIAASFQKIWGLDTWWQMAAGRWILANGFPTHDVLSYSASDHPWIEVRWIFCVLLHLGWQAGGPTLLVIAQTAALAGVWLMCAWPARRVLSSPVVLGVLALAMASGLSRWVLRPELCSYLFIPAFLLILEAAAPASGSAAASRRKLLWLLPCLQAVWTNSHTLFAIGPVFVWIWAFADAAQRIAGGRGWLGAAPQPRPMLDPQLFAAALFTTAACWLNPYGHAGATFPILLFTQIQSGHVVSSTIGEMAAPLSMPWEQWTLDVRLTPVLLAAVLATFVANRRGLSLPRLAVLLATAYLASKAQRNVALLSIVVAAVALRNLAEMRAASAISTPRWAPEAWGGITVGLLSGSLAWFVASDRWAVSIGAPREFGAGVVWWNTPREATEFLIAKKVKGPCFNAIRDGGYFAWAAQDAKAEGMKVFADGRLEVYGPEFLKELAELSPASWPAMQAKWNWNAAVIPIRGSTDLIAYLHDRKDWALVHLDHRDAIFVRTEGPNAELAARPLDLARPLDPSAPEEGVPRWKAAYGGVGRPFRTTGRVEALLALGADPSAEREARAGLALYPADVVLRESLGSLCYRSGKPEEARALLRGLPDAGRLAAAREAARLLTVAGRIPDSIPPLEDALAVTPKDPELLLAWADACFQSGQAAKARQGYERFLSLVNGSPNEYNKLAGVCDQLKDLPAAAAAYQKSLERNSDQPQVWNMLGGVMGNTGDLAGAERCFAKAVELKPDFTAAKNNLAKVRSMKR